MAKSVNITGPFTGGASAGSAIVNQQAFFTVAVSSLSTDAAVILQSITISEATESDAAISQPNIFPNNVPINSANPVLTGGGSLSYGFTVVFTSPRDPGISPNNPGGAAPGSRAQEADSNFILQAQAMFSDGTVATTNFAVSALSSVYPFPVPQGGEALFQQGADSNLIAVIA
jgi:hypothetical protein